MHPDRLIRLMRDAIQHCQLNLNGMTVLTEAATGAYVVTPLLAAMAGASRVMAIAKDSRFGSAADAAERTSTLAAMAGVEQRIEVISSITPAVLGAADIVTNSGHVRPISATMVSQMKPGAVVPLMYESWEFRAADLDLEACRSRGIRVGGTNERHPSIGVFEYLGVMAVKLLVDAGVCVYGDRILLVCDNDFSAYIEAGLRSAGAHVESCSKVPDQLGFFDAVLVASTPNEGSVLTDKEMQRIAQASPGAVIAQFFGDLDRQVIRDLGLPICPERTPDKGHMGILVSAVGPEPIVRLQAGGLKAGEVLFHGRILPGDPDAEYVQVM